MAELPARRRTGLEPAALLLGPLWAGRHGHWMLFVTLAFSDLVGLILIGQNLWPAPEAAAGGRGLAAGIALVLLPRLWLACAARRPFLLESRRRRLGRQAAGRGADLRLAGAALLALAIYPLTLYRFLATAPLESVTDFPQPAGWDTAVAKAIDGAVSWMTRAWVDFFDALTAWLRATLNFIEAVFVATPWPVVFIVALLIAWCLAGPRVMVFTAASLAYIGLLGFWEKSMATIAITATSVAICVVIGFPLGILCAKSRRARALLEPVMDVMQTLPTFVYLIPAVAFFSIGKPPGVIATVIFAMAPMVRLTALGILQVPAQVREAAQAFGASPAQLLFKVELPLALPSMKVGVNQTIMLSLSMVVVAAMIGAGGLGLDVIRSLQHLKTGQGVLAGVAIVLCAMVLDRMLRGRAARKPGKGP